MRMSCNGCRVLRKGCSENCSIKPCLEWIKSPESQANATVFLAKFYGRAGLLNLVNAGPEHLRPAIFRSLLYEACGRIVNPIYGSVGLLWSGSWSLCQTAVESVLRGESISTIGSELAEKNNGPPLKAYDIRHVSKDDTHRVRTRTRFKKSGSKAAARMAAREESSHESSLSHLSEAALAVEAESLPVVRAEPESDDSGSALAQASHEDGEVELELELTLGFEPVQRKSGTSRACGSADVGGENEVAMLGLSCSARAE